VRTFTLDLWEGFTYSGASKNSLILAHAAQWFGLCVNWLELQFGSSGHKGY
jgi:hypothetical protein